MNSGRLSILLADDHALFRKGLRSLLEQQEDFVVVFEAENGEAIIDYLKHNELPDIVLTDLSMPHMNGVEATKIIHETYPKLKIIALTSYFGKSFVLNMIHAGASSYLDKNSSPEDMLLAIREVYKNGFYYNAEVLRFIHEDMASPNPKATKSAFDDTFLTDREQEVLQLICEQYTTSEIAEKLFISPRTVEGHRNNLLTKTGSKNLAGLVVNAIKNKLVTLPF
ncbi:response regulator transcription factor [Mangrovimonas aestuarii]|uniref:response regulator transcription factor n=1 Tax=Mangrovimonas aestuarii TaxID=3018443 RepID=UPI00237993C0|nr:response regulator transcription factor [Mangrovimonas aestuarii]